MSPVLSRQICKISCHLGSPGGGQNDKEDSSRRPKGKQRKDPRQSVGEICRQVFFLFQGRLFNELWGQWAHTAYTKEPDSDPVGKYGKTKLDYRGTAFQLAVGREGMFPGRGSAVGPGECKGESGAPGLKGELQRHRGTPGTDKGGTG